MNKLLFISPQNLKEGFPAYERILAFKKYYQNMGFLIIEKAQPETFFQRVSLLLYIHRKKLINVFISMPPFRNWWIFLYPSLKIIIDFRDGWSIAMATGYGDTIKPKKLFSNVAKFIEKYAIRKSRVIITCTNGLKGYLESLSVSEVILIPNGYSIEDQKMVENLKTSIRKQKDINIIRAVCAGKFSEYGKDKVQIILRKLSIMFSGKLIKLILIGSNRENNSWIEDWLLQEKINNINVDILPRMLRISMYEEILTSDIAITIIRDPSYDFGTKIFDYILCGIPVFNYFDRANNFTAQFSFAFEKKIIETNRDLYIREKLVERGLKGVCL